MNNKLKSSIFVILFLLTSFISLSQKVFQASLKFPIGVNVNKIKIFYHTGKEWKKARLTFEDNGITSISDSFYSRFATLSCLYYSDGKESSFSSSFFVWEAPAAIVINELKDTLANPFSDCKLTNAFDIAKTEESKSFKLFTFVESNDYDNFLKKSGNQINGNDSLKAIKKEKYNKLMNKELEFVKQNGNKYYSLWLFQNELLSNDGFLSPDSLLNIFDNFFAQDLKKSFEGKQVESTLRGKVNIAGNEYIPYFKSIDIENKIVDLKNLKGKYILLNFWASWCKPCIAEFGTIKNLNDKYGKEALAVISISIDRDKQAFMKAVKKYGMNWTNIFHDIEIENVFLKKGGIPQVYLIDPTGKLIYSRGEQQDYNLKKLTELLKLRFKKY